MYNHPRLLLTHTKKTPTLQEIQIPSIMYSIMLSSNSFWNKLWRKLIILRHLLVCKRKQDIHPCPPYSLPTTYILKRKKKVLYNHNPRLLLTQTHKKKKKRKSTCIARNSHSLLLKLKIITGSYCRWMIIFTNLKMSLCSLTFPITNPFCGLPLSLFLSLSLAGTSAFKAFWKLSSRNFPFSSTTKNRPSPPAGKI